MFTFKRRMAMNDQLIIIIEVYGFLKNDRPAPSWEYSGISLVEILGGQQFPLCDDEIRVLCDSLVEIVPLKDERWHKMTLKRVYEKGGWQESDECYYEKINIELVPHRCLNCGAFIEKTESEQIYEYGVDPYCSQWCSEIGNGVPMPVSQGALTFDRIFNNP